MSTEAWVTKLERESDSLKSAFQRIASKIPVFTNSASHSTRRNATTVETSYGNTVVSDPERVLVTFDTDTGINTIAKLEIDTDGHNSIMWHRIPYSGGARWTVTAPTKNSAGSWQSTNYTFTVQSLVDGTVTVSEVSS